MEKPPKDAEHIVGGLIVLPKAEGHEPFGIRGRELECIDDQPAILPQQGSRLADLGRVDLTGRVAEPRAPPSGSSASGCGLGPPGATLNSAATVTWEICRPGRASRAAISRQEWPCARIWRQRAARRDVILLGPFGPGRRGISAAAPPWRSCPRKRLSVTGWTSNAAAISWSGSVRTSANCVTMTRSVPRSGSSRIRVGMSTGLIGVQVKAAEVEVDGLAEPLTAPKARGLFLEPLDA